MEAIEISLRRRASDELEIHLTPGGSALAALKHET
jgi:hypothetical protein